MNYSTYRITLDVRNTVSNVQLTAKKGDAGRKVYITLSDKGKPCEIADGSYAVFAGVKPDGKLLYNKTTIENNTIIYEMTQQTTAVAGLVACEVKLFDSMSNLLTSPKLTIWVDDVVVPDEEIVSKDEVTAFAELVFEANKVIDLGNQTIAAGNAATEATIAATTAATEATQNANAATTEANTATDSANNAAASANAAASNATQETYSANIAATNANNAASDARIATEETNTARENIQQTASEVLTSLSNAVFAPPIESSASGAVVAVNDASNYLLSGLTIYGKTTQNGTELETAGASGTIKTTVCEKNLFNPAIFTDNGFTETDGVYYGATSNLRDKTIKHVFKENTQYVLSFMCNAPNANGSINYLYISFVYTDGTIERVLSVHNIEEVNHVAISKVGKTMKHIYFTYGSAASAYFRDVQLEEGTAVTDFEPYKGQTLAVPTPNGLPGIPVSSGGNYTEESGQKRLCDYKDCANGVGVKRINTKVFDGTEDFDVSSIGTDNAFFGYRLPANVKAHIVAHDCISMCSHFQKANIATSTTTQGYLVRDMSDSGITRVLFRPENVASMTEATFKTWLAEQYNSGTPVTVQYELETPIETPLSAEEKAQYAALHTNKPNTTVYNDAGAWLKLEYVADTKTYIDNQFTELQNAILSAGANI